MTTDETLDSALAAACDRWGGRVAIVDGDRVVTYGELAEMAGNLAGSYQSHGLAAGDRVLCQLGNSVEHIVAAVGAWIAGLIHVGVHPDITVPELAKRVREIDAMGVILPDRSCVSNYLIKSSSAKQPMLMTLERKTADSMIALRSLFIPPGLSRMTSDPRSARPIPNDAAVVFFTSGTTGTSKAVLASHGPLLASWQTLAVKATMREADNHLTHLPIAHAFGLGSVVMALVTGGTLVLLNRFSPTQAVRRIEEKRVTVLSGTPTHFQLVLDALARVGGDVTSLRTGLASGAAFSPALLGRIFNQLGMDVVLVYGSSEGAGLSTNDRDVMMRGSVGVPSDGFVAILDPDARTVPTGGTGEIVLRTYSPVRYWPKRNEPPDTETMWHHSGDLGRLDSEGRLYVLGRLKDEINRGGQKIDSGEVTLALMSCPGVADAAVLGSPEPTLGEIVCAFLVPKEGFTLELQHLRSSLASSLARYKLPEELRIVRAIPRNRMGKVDNQALRDAGYADGEGVRGC